MGGGQMNQLHRGFRCFSPFWKVLFLLFTLFSEASGFELKGFGDVNFRKSTLTESPDHNGSFVVGDQIDFFVSMTLADRIDFLSEMIFSKIEEIPVIQRFYIGYLFSDALKVRVGRFHNPIGYWNPAFHHGAFLHTTIDRPFLLKFEYEEGVLPAHMVGIWTSGRYDPGPLTFEYDLSAANGSKIEQIDPASQTRGELDPNTFDGDNNRNKAVSFRLQVGPKALPGWRAMGFGHINTVEGFDTASLLVLKVDQSILGLAAVHVIPGSGLNFLSEIYWVRDKDQRTDSGTYTNLFYYIQAGYTFFERLTPYARYEEMKVKEEDPYMTALSAVDNRRTIVGIRHEVSLISALKGEIRRIRTEGGEDHSEYAIQWAFSF
jgi:hypothetical protein